MVSVLVFPSEERHCLFRAVHDCVNLLEPFGGVDVEIPFCGNGVEVEGFQKSYGRQGVGLIGWGIFPIKVGVGEFVILFAIGVWGF